MSRRLYLDRAPGETRGVVMLDGRPEHLLVQRTDDPAVQALGARVAVRVRRIERRLASAFLDMGEGPDAILPLTGEAKDLVEGAAVEVDIAAEARRGKGAAARLIGPARAASGLMAPAPSLPERLAAIAPGEAIMEGPEAREAADAAEDAALAIEHPLPGGALIAIEPTRALVAVDVDLGVAGGDARQAARRANLAAVGETARLLRLKSLAGLVIIDLIGSGHDGPTLAEAAKAAFAPDQPGVSIGPLSRFGVLQLVLPRRARPLAERFLEADGCASPTTTALRLLRGLEREGRADGGARLVGCCAPAAARAAAPYISELTGRIGPRFEIRPDAGLPRDHFEIRTL
jgi:Ribonuclease G/E